MDRINRACIYYPCHDKEKLNDCVFCYCYRWPCGDPSLGYYLENGIWACEKCTWPHNKERVDKIYDFLKNNFKE